MARYKLILAYDGTSFSGSQRQAGGRTVQGELEKSLRSLGWKASSVLLAGRTDAGVHASGQVAALDFEWAHGTDALRDALNAKLPVDMAVRFIQVVEDRFHPRFDAVSRSYSYQVLHQPVRDPLKERTAWRIWPPLNEVVLEKIARRFIGAHDFRAFGSASRKDGGTVRTVTVSQWTREGEHLRFEIAANGFLFRMVRRLVFIQIAAAQGKCKEEVVALALQNASSHPDIPAGLAPPRGLFLMGVDY